MPEFSHLHTHTQFSLLDGAASISGLYKKAVADNQRAIAITDHGNMFGVFKFVAEASLYNLKDKPEVIRPIIGCEFYMVENRFKKEFTKDNRDVRYHQLLLAKDEKGYENLSKLCSLGYLEGLYSKYPRIDKELISQFHEGLIATTCCLGAIVPKAIIKKGEEEAEKEFKWWLDLFGEDYYIELQRHGLKEQDKVNEVLMKWAEKYNVPMIATNDSHYVDKEDSYAHDILLCVNTGEKISTPKMSEDEIEVEASETSSFKKRFAFPNDNFYFKTKDEMLETFKDVPQAIDNTAQIVDKIKTLKLFKDIMLPNFPVPEGFNNQMHYLEHITYEGARRKYGEITSIVEERLRFELGTISEMGFAGYFLIVSDFIKAGKDLGVIVGPGRGSAAGSAVAYCIDITNIDPIKYNLLFERFLNPARKSMPDIDTDFDDEGRQKVIDYVVDKYGKNQVAQIVTYGKMASKMSVKDVARVLDLEPQESNYITSLFPQKPMGLTLKQILTAKIEGVKNEQLLEKLDDPDKEEEEEENKETISLRGEDIPNVEKLREWYRNYKENKYGEILRTAMSLEGSVRNTGVHAAGIIIAPKDLKEIVPVALAKDSNLLLTQYEGKVIEDAGVIKMDFLGLKTLSIIKTCLELIEKIHNIKIDIDNLPLDDETTFKLYQKGDTIGTFQFESVGMQKYLKELKPNCFEDLIAMNALYRPGPMDYIPLFIKRKNGIEPVVYDLPELEEHLAETFGITVYQEQVMLISQKLGNFSKGDADFLRKAMGKKDRKTLDKMKGQFIEGCDSNNIDLKMADKIWTDWEAFASYAFNKSHSTCYALVAYQTGYLKAHYPSEYMAAVLTHNVNNIEKISQMMSECKRMGIKVLCPDINESEIQFSVNKEGQIRFGLCAVKGVGEAPAETIINERNAAGPFKNIFELTSRCSLKSMNKRTLEALAKSGAFGFDKTIHKAQYLETNEENVNGIELAIKYGSRAQEQKNSSQASLFGGGSNQDLIMPKMPKVEEYSLLDECNFEKEMVGIYINQHPLDTFKFEYNSLVNTKLHELQNIEEVMQKGKIIVAGLVTQIDFPATKKGTTFAKMTLQDYESQHSFSFFNENYNVIKIPAQLNEFLLLDISFEKSRYKDNNNIYLKLNRVTKLYDIKEKLKSILLIKIPTTKLNYQLIDTLDEILTSSPGKTEIKIMLKDYDKNYQIDLSSREYKIEMNSDIEMKLKELDVEFKYNIQY